MSANITLRNAVKKVDNDAPARLHGGKPVPTNRMKIDMERCFDLRDENVKLLQLINTDYRRTDTTQKTNKSSSPEDAYKLKKAKPENILKKKLRNIQKDNLIYFKAIKSSKPIYSIKDSEESWKGHVKRYPSLQMPISNCLLNTRIVPDNIKETPSERNICFLELLIDGFKSGRLTIEVYTDIVPKSALNFVTLCRPTESVSYKDTVIFHCTKGLFCIGGDVINNTGTGTTCIYGKSFPYENRTLTFGGPGVVAMYSQDGITNNSQFLITFKKLDALNKRFVVVGKVLRTLFALEAIEDAGSKSGKTTRKVEITDCGILK